MMMTEKCKKKREARKKKARARLAKLLRPEAMELLRQQALQEGHPALKKTKAQLAKCQKNNKSLLNCADKLLDLLDITIKQADALKSWLVDAPKEANKHQQAKREDTSYAWSVVEKEKVEKQRADAIDTLDRVEEFLKELNKSEKDEML